MALTVTQLGLCFQSYWYMWLTNGLAGLLFLGIDIGIAAFFLKKFGKTKAANYQRPASGAQRPFTPTEVKINDSVDASGRKSGLRASSAASDKSGSSGDADDFAYSTLQAVNAARSQHNAQPVELDDQLSVIAQRWADNMARTGKLEHSPAEQRSFGRQTLGENFIALFQTELTGPKMVKRWLKEGRKYNFGSQGTRDTENFTQLVWQGTREIGVGRARSEDGNWWYGVVVFNPPGNIPNQYPSNVLLP